MEFLKEVLGDELYKQLETALNSYNGNEANKDKQIKLANLATGAYVSKDKYSALETNLTSRQTELDKANGLIEELKKGTKGNEALQGKITSYESQVAQLQAELEKTKLDAAIKVALLSEKAMDVDYLTFKLKEKGELSLDKDGKIKGIDDMLAGLKTQFPAFFGSADDQREIQPHKLPDHKKDEGTMTKAEFLRKPYAERAAFANENPEAYNTIMNH